MHICPDELAVVAAVAGGPFTFICWKCRNAARRCWHWLVG